MSCESRGAQIIYPPLLCSSGLFFVTDPILFASPIKGLIDGELLLSLLPFCLDRQRDTERQKKEVGRGPHRGRFITEDQQWLSLCRGQGQRLGAPALLPDRIYIGREVELCHPARNGTWTGHV